MTIFSEYQYLCKSIGYFHLPLPLVVYNCPDFQKKVHLRDGLLLGGGGGDFVHTYKLYIHLFVSQNVCLRYCDHNIYGADNNNSTL